MLAAQQYRQSQLHRHVFVVLNPLACLALGNIQDTRLGQLTVMVMKVDAISETYYGN